MKANIENSEEKGMERWN